MVRYRRNRVPDGTFFFTVTLRDRRSDALVRHVDALRDAWRAAKTRIPHEVVAAVVLPDHLHAVIAMRDGGGDYPRLWQDIKKGFTRRMGASSSPWQARYWEHTIRDDADLRRHVAREARAGGSRGELAAFLVPSLRGPGIVAGGLGWHRQADNRG